jgi:hypothetical protein
MQHNSNKEREEEEKNDAKVIAQFTFIVQKRKCQD